MDKKGQTTYFVLMGIVLIAIIGILLYFGSSYYSEKNVPSELDEIRVLVQDCLEEEMIKAKDNKLLKEGMEDREIEEANNLWKENMEKRINEKIPLCLETGIFPGVEVKFDEINTVLSVLGHQNNNYFVLEAIHADAEIPVTIKKGSNTYAIRNFYAVYEA